MFKTLLAIAALTVNEPPTQPHFDLICVGPTTMLAPDMSEPIRRNGESTLHIDLVGMRWCEDECRRIAPINTANDNFIALDQVDYPAFGAMAHPVGTAIINRLTGTYSVNLNIGKVTFLAEYGCERAPYTPMPLARF